MIKSIDISCFGSFKDFVWRHSVREGANVLEFKRLNILYGRNYSGKTTLSRIMRSLQVHKLPDNYEAPCFSVTTDSGTLDQTMIASHNLNIRVYNKDFVDGHLSFLRDTEGNITPFAVVGGENKSIQEKITKIEENLGSISTDTGLRYRHAAKHTDFVAKQHAVTKAEADLKAKLTNKATKPTGGIKHNPIYKDPNYNTPKLEADIQTVRRESREVLREEQMRDKRALLAETALPDIGRKLQFSPVANRLHEQSQEFLERRIAPTRPIRDLLDDALLQAWAKTGISHHRDKRSTCGFCGETLKPDLWEKLDAHFSNESQQLGEGVGRQIKEIDAEIERAYGIFTLKEEDFYSTNHSLLQQLRRALDHEITKYVSELEEIKKALKARQDDIFTPRSLPDLSDNTADIADQIARINALIVVNNQKTLSLAADQKQARHELRLSEVAQFIIDIGLTADEKRIADLQVEAGGAMKEVRILSSEITQLEGEVGRLLTLVTDERKGAEKVNEYLNHFFGDKRLSLAAVEDPDSSNFKFQIVRGSDPAYNLSEGECSLVAFCYFLAKLEDADTKGKDLMVYIDDPISSLDSNHIFFLYSLIESVLAKPNKKSNGSNEYRYRQLFISTHNLDFFKYLKRLSAPNSKHGDTAYFLVERGGEHSQVSPMPAYLKQYTTEFNYLFDQIYKCRDAQDAKDNHERFYSFGNNLRKFLEAYLFYRYPHHDNSNDSSERLRKFFGDDAASTALTNRLMNELSHLEETFDRSMRPIEIPEIPALANFVLDKIYEKDPDQYNSLLKSIGQAPREPASDSGSKAGSSDRWEDARRDATVAAGRLPSESA